MDTDPRRHAEDIASALHGHIRGSGWSAHCPAHDDSHPSLDLDVKDDKLLLKCRAGCSQESVIDSLRARGLWDTSEKKTDIKSLAKRPAVKKKLVASYQYIDSETGVVGTKERYERTEDGKQKKSCVWRAPDGSTGLDGAKPSLFRLDKLRSAPPDGWVLLVEGEKCVLAAEELGFVATCGSMGADKWEDTWSEHLRGRKVALLPDNDEPGKKHMRMAGASLKGMATVKGVLLPDLPLKGDIVDWIAAGGTREALLDLLNAPKAKPKRPIRLQVVDSMADIQAEDVSWLWFPYIPLGKFTLLEGDPGVCKSWLALAVAAALSVGARLPGDDSPREPGKTLLLAGEDGLGDTVRPRLAALGADLTMVRPVTGLLKEEEELSMTLSEDGVAGLMAEIEDYRPQLLIIDPLIAYTPGKVDQNKASEVRAMLRPLADMAQKCAIAVLALRHLNKGTGANAAYRGQGSIDYFALSRSVLFVGRDSNDKNRSVMVPNKSSLTAPGPAQAFRVGPGAGGAEFLWEGDVDLSVEDLLTAEEPEQASALTEAKEFLKDVLFNGPMTGVEVQRLGRAAGVMERTLWRAKGQLKVKAIKQPGAGGQWVWDLPHLNGNAVSSNGHKPEESYDFGSGYILDPEDEEAPF